MNGTTHKIGGFVSGVIMATTVNVTVPFLLVGMTGGIVGSLIPDIDEPKSIVGKKVRMLSKGVKTIFGHRGIIHTPVFLAIIFFLMFACKEVIAPVYLPYADLFIWSFTAGYISHLLLDMFTPQGIMILYPLSSFRFSLMSLKGKHRDLIASSLCILVLILYLGYRYNILTINFTEIRNLVEGI